MSFLNPQSHKQCLEVMFRDTGTHILVIWKREIHEEEKSQSFHSLTGKFGAGIISLRFVIQKNSRTQTSLQRAYISALKLLRFEADNNYLNVTNCFLT